MNRRRKSEKITRSAQCRSSRGKPPCEHLVVGKIENAWPGRDSEGQMTLVEIDDNPSAQPRDDHLAATALEELST